MESSRKSTTPTDDGDEYQSDGCSRSGTDPGSPHPFHPTTSILCLPKTSKAATTGSGKEAIYLGSRKVPAQYSKPLTRTPSPDDVLMNNIHLEEYMKEISEKANEKRRASRNAPWNDQSESDDERPKHVPETSSAVSKTPHRRASQTASRRPFGVSKPPRPGPSRARSNAQTDLTTRGGQVATRLGLRSQRTVSMSQNDETSTGGEEMARRLERGVEDMSINDQRM
jgi:hypothetical protein